MNMYVSMLINNGICLKIDFADLEFAQSVRNKMFLYGLQW